MAARALGTVAYAGDPWWCPIAVPGAVWQVLHGMGRWLPINRRGTREMDSLAGCAARL
jgi:hypothetical protein